MSVIKKKIQFNLIKNFNTLKLIPIVLTCLKQNNQIFVE